MSGDSSRRRAWLIAAVSVLAVAGSLVGLSLSASARNVTVTTRGAASARQAASALRAVSGRGAVTGRQATGARAATSAHEAVSGHHDSAVTVDSTVGDSGFADVGAEAEGCTSASPDLVACGVPDSTSTVKYWCLGATPSGGVALTVTKSESAAVNPVTVNCAARPAPTVGFPGTIRIQLFTATSEYDNESCSTSSTDASCSTPDSSNAIDVTCSPGIAASTVTVTVVASSPIEVEGKSVSFPVNCPGGTPLNVSSTVGSGGQVNAGGEVEDCTSAAPDQVACGVFDSQPVVKWWCLAPTPARGVIITANPSEDAPVASVTVNCGPMPVTTINSPGSKKMTMFPGTEFEAESCSTDTPGSSCSVPDSSNVLTVTCRVGVGMVTVTVVGSDGDTSGKSASFEVDCR